MFDFNRLRNQPPKPPPEVPGLIIGITGHRPDKLESVVGREDGYVWDNPLRRELRKRIEEKTRSIQSTAKRDRMDPDYVASRLRRVQWTGTPITSGDLCVSGGALGIDQDACGVWHRMGLPYLVIIPFPGQERRWPEEAQARYAAVLNHAAGIVMVSKEQPQSHDEAGTMLKNRNELLCLLSNDLIAVFDGSRGGTGHCLAYWHHLMRNPDHRIDPRDVREDAGSDW